MDTKDKLRDKIYSYYKANGYAKTLNVAKSILESENSTGLIRGELCECVLVIFLEEFIKVNKIKDWIISKGLILRDLENPDSSYLTELDVTLFTPKRIFLFECKSYSGNKILTGKGQIAVKSGKKYNKKIDVYEQHIKHYIALHKYLKDFKYGRANSKPFKMAMFDFSTSGYVDRRDSNAKGVLPLVTPETVSKLFSNYNKLDVCWDIDYVKEVVKIMENNKEKITSKHLEYVKSLHARS